MDLRDIYSKLLIAWGQYHRSILIRTRALPLSRPRFRSWLHEHPTGSHAQHQKKMRKIIGFSYNVSEASLQPLAKPQSPTSWFGAPRTPWFSNANEHTVSAVETYQAHPPVIYETTRVGSTGSALPHSIFQTPSRGLYLVRSKDQPKPRVPKG